MCCSIFNYPVPAKEYINKKDFSFATKVGMFVKPDLSIQPFFSSWKMTDDGWEPPIPFPQEAHLNGDCWKWDETLVSWIPCDNI